MKKEIGLFSELPLEEGETGVLIKWDKATGRFQVFFEGPDVHLQQLQFLMQESMKALKDAADEKGVISTSGPDAEYEKPEQESEGDTPPWLKKTPSKN